MPIPVTSEAIAALEYMRDEAEELVAAYKNRCYRYEVLICRAAMDIEEFGNPGPAVAAHLIETADEITNEAVRVDVRKRREEA